MSWVTEQSDVRHRVIKSEDFIFGRDFTSGEAMIRCGSYLTEGGV
jgi:hypothetical protein